MQPPKCVVTYRLRTTVLGEKAMKHEGERLSGASGG